MLETTKEGEAMHASISKSIQTSLADLTAVNNSCGKCRDHVTTTSIGTCRAHLNCTRTHTHIHTQARNNTYRYTHRHAITLTDTHTGMQ